MLARGLALPELAALDLGEVVERACSDHERKIGRHVDRAIGPLPVTSSPALKIAAYRILQEALANAFRHANGSAASVRVAARDGWVVLECVDAGPGLDGHEEGLGIRGMRERAELLGGRVEIGTDGSSGTVVRASLPVS
jgi:signal transduction histidine kinase